MLARLHRDERGMALITVLIASFVIVALVTGLMAYATGSLPISKHDQDWNAALAAAEAGVDDYVYRVNQDHSYVQYSASIPPPDRNKAFTQWVPVPGAANAGQFRYDVDTSTLAAQGTVQVTSTGKVGNSTRSVLATLRSRAFIDYLYFTDYETKDPAIYNTGYPENDDFTPAQAQTSCALHYYEGRDSNCTDIYFTSEDTVSGPLHTNDALLTSGSPNFLGNTTTSWNDPNGKFYRGSGTPNFSRTGDPQYVAPLTLPATDASIKATTATGQGGCLFTGPTSITFNSGGTMNVTSPFTRSSNCSTGANRPLPINGVIFVQAVPTSSADPNYTAGCPYTNSSPLGYPIAGDISTYNCRDGDAFVQGTLKGRITIATEHDVVIVGNTQYAGGLGGTDLLGLIANNNIEIYHPVSCSSRDSSGNCTGGQNLPYPNTTNYFRDPVIQAAILSVQHSFLVQSHRLGAPLGDINLTGSIGQKYRGIVGTFGGSGLSSGYSKNYVYDQRLATQTPPHFLDPIATTWQQVAWSEVTPVYK